MLCPQETLLWKTYITETCCFVVVQWIELTSDSFWTVRRNNSIWVDVLPIKLLFFVLDCEHEYINRRSRNRASFHINFSSSRLKLQSPTEIWTITFSLFSQTRCNSPQCSSFVWQSWEQYLEHSHQVNFYRCGVHSLLWLQAPRWAVLTLAKELMWLATEEATRRHQSTLGVGHITGGLIPGVGGFQTTGLEHQSTKTVLGVGRITGVGGFLTPGQEPSMGGAENGFEQ